MSVVEDDKSDHCVPFILSHLTKKSFDDTHQSPIFIGVNGAQGSGKTTLVSLNRHQLAMGTWTMPHESQSNQLKNYRSSPSRPFTAPYFQFLIPSALIAGSK